MMKKTLLIAAFLLALPLSSEAARQSVTQITGTQASVGALKTQVNTRLDATDDNFIELYDGKADKTAAVRYWSDWPTTSPNNVLAVGTIVAYDGALYKVTQELTKTGSTADPATLTAYFTEVGAGDNLGSATAADVAALFTTGTGDCLGANGQLVACSGSGGIAHATSDGSYYASKDGAWASLASVYQPLDGDLTAFAGLTCSENQIPKRNASNTWVCGSDNEGAGGGISHATSDGNYYASRNGAWASLAGLYQTADSDLTTWAGITPGTGVGAWLATPSGANLASALTSALPATKGGTGLTALGTGVATALGNNVNGTGGLVTYDSLPPITWGTGLTDTSNTISVTYPVTAESWSGSGWNADTDGLQRNDAYDYLHIADTDDDGLPNKVDLSSAGLVATDANGVLSSTSTLPSATIIPDSGTLTFDESAADPDDADIQLSATDGVFKIAAVNGANNEDLTIDLDAAANKAKFNSGSGLTLITTGSIPFTGAIRTVGKSADYTIGTDDADEAYGSFFVNTGASTRTFTLPSAVAGMSVCVRNGQGVSQVLRLDANTGDYIVKSTGARTSAAAEYYGATADAKNQLCVVAYDSTDWYVTSEVGTWTEE